MNDLLKKICVFVRCRERAAVIVAVVCMAVIVLTSHVVIISAFSGYNLRYPLDPDNPVDLSLHYVRFESAYDNIAVESTGFAITYSSNSGGRSAYLYPNSLYQYYSNLYWHVAIRADAAQPKLTARSIYTVSIPDNLINNSGDYWEGFSDWQIKAPDPFGDAAYTPESLQTVSVSSLESNDVRVYYPEAGDSLNIDNGYPPTVEMHSCTDSEQVVDLSSYVGLEYGTLADVVQTVDIQQSELSNFIDSIYGASTDDVFTHCIQVVFGEGSLVHSDAVGSYENGPQYYLELLKYENLVGAGEIVNTMIDGRYTFEFDFNQGIDKGSPETVDKYARLYNADGILLDSLPVSSSGDAIIGNSTNTGDDETNDALFVTFGVVLEPGSQYYVLLDEQSVTSGWDYVRTAPDPDDYRITIANDNDAPIVLGKTPAPDDEIVASTGVDIVLTFDEPVVPQSFPTTYDISNGVSTTTITASSIGQYDTISGSQLTLDVAGIINQAYSTTTGLAAGTTYTFRIPQSIVQDDQGNEMDSPVYVVFSTQSSTNDDDQPIVVTKTPSFGAINVATSTQEILLTFDEPIFATTSLQTFDISNGISTSTVVAVSIGQYNFASGNELTIEIDELVNQAFSTTTGLSAATTYTVKIPQHIIYDDVNTYMSGPVYFVFTTVDNFEESLPEDEEEIPVQERDSRPPSGRRSRQGDVGGSVTGGSGVFDSSSGESFSGQTDVGNGTISTFRDLFFGATGTDVLELQQALNRIGFTVNETGAGSAGQETEYFGTSTQAAVTRFQMNFGIMPNIGYFGPITRALLGFILGR